MLLHHVKRTVSTGFLFIERRLPVRRVSKVADNEARRSDVRFMAVLLKEQPLQYLCARPCVGAAEFRAVREITQDRIRFSQVFPIRQNRKRDLAVRVHGQELRRARLSGKDIDLVPLVSGTELGAGELKLVAVTGNRIAVKLQGIAHVVIPSRCLRRATDS